MNKARRDWAFRLYEESKDHAFTYFITLTYDDYNLPFLNLETGEYPVRLNKIDTEVFLETDRIEKIVLKSDVQKFMKSVRRQQQYYEKKNKIPQQKIRYYITSEYGTQKTKRPHRS